MELDRNAPATKGDLADLESRINERYDMLRAEVQHGYNDLRETLRDSQTELLKAFYSFGQSNSKRFAELEGNEAAIRSRLGTIEDRLMELERRVNTPPTQ
jgi:hypothetical protein